MSNIAEILLCATSRKLRTSTILLLLHLIWIVNATNENSEIITIQKQNHVKCITENTTSPIYVLPPIVEDAKYDSSLVVNGDWTDNDWLVKHASNSAQGSVKDKRWEDFKTVFTKLQRFVNKTSIAFSIYAKGDIQFFMTNEESTDYIKVERNNPPEWIHFHIISKYGNVILLKDNEIIRTGNFVPTQIVIKTRERSYWKIHEYDYKWADTITKDEPTTLTVVPTSEKKCVMFYVSVCQECFLDIFMSSNQQILRVNDLNEDSQTMMANSWQLRKVDIEPGTENVFKFYRARKDDNEAGEWAVDIRWCPDVSDNNKVIYAVDSPEADQKDRTCHLLGEQAVETKGKMEATTEENKTGETGCSSGSWGLSCEKKCESICKECDKTTGQCAESETTRNLGTSLFSIDPIILVIVAAITISVVGTVLVLVLILWLRKRSANYGLLSDGGNI